jgi:glutamine synthetase
MYTDYAKYPDLPKLPDQLDQSLNELKNNEHMNEAFGKDVIESFIKLRKSEIKEFNSKENFNKTKPITKWEKENTLDC